jgi:glycosyltransferase involved in cell wall biosynthesis
VIRVLHIVVAGDIGGAERLIVDLAYGAPKDQPHALLLMTPNPKLRAFFLDAGLRVLDRGEVRENPVAFLKRSYGSSDLAWAASVATRERTSVVHAHTLGSHVLAARLGKACALPVVRTEHHFSHYQDPTASPFTRSSLHGTHQLVAVSAFIARKVVQAVPAHAHKLSVIRNGVNVETFAYRAPRDSKNLGPLRFGIACRLERWKGVHLAIEAMRELTNAHLRIAGTGHEHDRLRALAGRLGVTNRVEFCGHVTDVTSFYANVDLALNTSESEPLGLSVLEALAVGRPVLAFAEGGIPEIVSHGTTGFLVRERSAYALAAMMREAQSKSSQLHQMGLWAREFAEGEASAKVMSELYTQVYQRHA